MRIGESAKQARTSGMRRKASREDDLPIDFFKCRVVILLFDFSRWIVELH